MPRRGESTRRTQTVLAVEGRVVASWAGEGLRRTWASPQSGTSPQGVDRTPQARSLWENGADHGWVPGRMHCGPVFIQAAHTHCTPTVCQYRHRPQACSRDRNRQKAPASHEARFLTGRRLGERPGEKGEGRGRSRGRSWGRSQGEEGISLHREAEGDISEVATFEQRGEEVR